LSKKALVDAERHFGDALRSTPDDYAALLRMSQTLQARGRLADARGYAEQARKVYPQEAQAVKLGATLKLGLREPGAALADLEAYDRMLPGDSGVGFLKGVAYEGMGRRAEAARLFNQVVAQSRDSAAGKYASTRLKAWGYLR
jgi:tetratricopeptide (TPR) repeat protein